MSCLNFNPFSYLSSKLDAHFLFCFVFSFPCALVFIVSFLAFHLLFLIYMSWEVQLFGNYFSLIPAMVDMLNDNSFLLFAVTISWHQFVQAVKLAAFLSCSVCCCFILWGMHFLVLMNLSLLTQNFCWTIDFDFCLLLQELVNIATVYCIGVICE